MPANEETFNGSIPENGLSEMGTSTLKKNKPHASWYSGAQLISRKIRARFPVRITKQLPYLRKVRTQNQQMSPKRSKRHCDLIADIECRSSFPRRRSVKRSSRYVPLEHVSDCIKLPTSPGNSNTNNSSNSDSNSTTANANVNNDNEIHCRDQVSSNSNGSTINHKRNERTDGANSRSCRDNYNNNSGARVMCRARTPANKSRSPSRCSTTKSNSRASPYFGKRSRDTSPGIIRAGSGSQLSRKASRSSEKRKPSKREGSPDKSPKAKNRDQQSNGSKRQEDQDGRMVAAVSKSDEILPKVQDVVEMDAYTANTVMVNPTGAKRKLVRKKSKENKQRDKSSGAKTKTPVTPKRAQKTNDNSKQDEVPPGGTEGQKQTKGEIGVEGKKQVKSQVGSERDKQVKGQAGAEGDKQVSSDDKKSVIYASSENSVNSYSSTQCTLDPSLGEYLNNIYELRRSRFKAEVKKLKATSFGKSDPTPLAPLAEAAPCRDCREEQVARIEDGFIGDGVVECVKKTAELSFETISDTPPHSLETSRDEDEAANVVGSVVYREHEQTVIEKEGSRGYELYGLCFLVAATVACLYHVWDRKQETKHLTV